MWRECARRYAIYSQFDFKKLEAAFVDFMGKKTSLLDKYDLDDQEWDMCVSWLSDNYLEYLIKQVSKEQRWDKTRLAKECGHVPR